MKSPATQNPYVAMLRIAWQYAGAEKKRFLLIYSMFLMSNLAMAAYPIIWGIFINDIQQNGMNVLRSAWLYGGAYLLIRLADWAFHGPARIMERNLAFHLSRNFLQEYYNKALHLPVKWHQDHHSGETINRIRKAYEALKKFFEDGFEYLHTIFKFVFSFIAMIYFTPVFGAIAAMLGALVVFIILKFDKPYIETTRQVNEKEHKVNAALFDSLSNILTVITLRLEKRMESGLMKRVAEILPPFRKNVVVNEWKWFFTDMMVGVIYALIIVGFIWQNWEPGKIFLLGGLVTLISFVEKFTSVFHNVAYLYTDVVKHHTDLTTAFNIREAYEQQHLPDEGNFLPADWKTITIENLNFSHRETNLPAGSPVIGLSEVSLKIERGKKIALIGESGSGKSTLLAMLRGLFQAEENAVVKVDGNLATGLAVISNHVTLFPQEPEIFENTIEYNITLGLPFEPGEVKNICEMVALSQVVAQLPKGMESSIQEKGVNLSGGQKQRLALARGIFAAKESDILLLDEPSSSVDPKTEGMIYDRIFGAFPDKAVISALHRLHLLPRFDYICILENGKIVEEGTFENLLQGSVRFREFWAHQKEAEKAFSAEPLVE